MIDRRRFLQTLAAAAAAPRTNTAHAAAGSAGGFGPLLPDPRQTLDLPAGFSWHPVSRQGELMDDGLRVPGKPDGMAAFPGKDGRIVLVCNHELWPGIDDLGPFAGGAAPSSWPARDILYDAGGGVTPGLGGTTTIVYDPRRRRTLRRHLSLAGTELNCAGGATPWQSWLSCEETFTGPNAGGGMFNRPTRDARHGYVFEVPAHAPQAAKPVALTGMGRFEHEAVAVDPRTGVVYLTEDRHRSLLYRFVPNRPGRLGAGGRLQALAVADRPSCDTSNWQLAESFPVGKWFEVAWIDLEDVDSERNDLRFRGHAAGAAQFARGEGICHAGGEIVFTCTIGGADRLGQIFRYRPSTAEGQAHETRARARLQLLTESTPDSVLRNADNITFAPWGDLVVCEDTADHCGLVGVTGTGREYPLADNPYTGSELAGATFSPDGKVLFVNIQHDGLTLAITGPWRRG